MAHADVNQSSDWIIQSSDNQGLPFVIIDKVDARIYVFKPNGQMVGNSPALLGSAIGDHTVPGIGDKEYADMPPESRTTPAGRFVAELGTNAHGKTVVWVDYNAAVSIHPVITTNPKERRLQRLATPTPLDNRISYGCINLPVKFFNKIVKPTFTGTNGIVYILPELP